MELIAASGRQRIPKAWFGTYLRTGATPWEKAADGIELKFNPWHDPKNGRFTSAGQGTWDGGGFTGGGGGSFGGGGASGSWTSSAPKKARNSTQAKQPTPQQTLAIVQAAAAVSAAKQAQTRAQEHVIVRNGYSYHFSADGGVTLVDGQLTFAPGQRSRSAQANAGGSDRLSTDDGGHYIAVRFNGPTDTFNHFAQDANFNRGAYRALEDSLAKDLKSGKRIDISIIPTFPAGSKRPSEIEVRFTIDGRLSSRSFPNTPKGKSHGK